MERCCMCASLARWYYDGKLTLVSFFRLSLGMGHYMLTTSQPDVAMPVGDTRVPGAYLQYNEYIAYDVAQVRLRYLLRIRM